MGTRTDWVLTADSSSLDDANKFRVSIELSDHMLLKDSALSCFDFTFSKVKIITHSQFDSKESKFRIHWARNFGFKKLLIEEFDHGSDWTLAAGLTHASRAETKGCLHLWRRAADGWVMLGNMPYGGGQQLETTANTAWCLRTKVGDLRASRHKISPSGIS